jgi:hypothetical protein
MKHEMMERSKNFWEKVDKVPILWNRFGHNLRANLEKCHLQACKY